MCERGGGGVDLASNIVAPALLLSAAAHLEFFRQHLYIRFQHNAQGDCTKGIQGVHPVGVTDAGPAFPYLPECATKEPSKAKGVCGNTRTGVVVDPLLGMHQDSSCTALWCT